MMRLARTLLTRGCWQVANGLHNVATAGGMGVPRRSASLSPPGVSVAYGSPGTLARTRDAGRGAGGSSGNEDRSNVVACVRRDSHLNAVRSDYPPSPEWGADSGGLEVATTRSARHLQPGQFTASPPRASSLTSSPMRASPYREAAISGSDRLVGMPCRWKHTDVLARTMTETHACMGADRENKTLNRLQMERIQMPGELEFRVKRETSQPASSGRPADGPVHSIDLQDNSVCSDYSALAAAPSLPEHAPAISGPTERGDETLQPESIGETAHVPAPSGLEVPEMLLQCGKGEGGKAESEMTLDGRRLVRSGQERTVRVRRILASPAPLSTIFGIGISFRPASNGAYVVTDIDKKGGSDVSGVSAGDIILAVDGIATSALSTSQLVQAR